MTIQKHIDLLKHGDLSTNELQTILNTIYSILPLSETESLELATILLNHVIPQTYTLMDENLQAVTCHILCSKVAVLQIIRIIKDDNEEETSMRKKYICLNLLSDLVNNIENLIENFIQYQGNDYDTWSSLLTVKMIDIFGYIKVWLSNHSNLFQEITIESEKIKRSEEMYVSKVASALLKRIPTVEKFEALQCSRRVLSYFFSVEPQESLLISFNNWNEWKNLFMPQNEFKMRQIRQLKDSQRTIILVMLNAINNIISIENLLLYRALIADLLTNADLAGLHDSVMAALINMKLEMTFLWLKQDKHIDLTYLCEKLKKLGNKNFIINTPVNDQRNLMNHILVYLHFLDENQLTEISKGELFLEVISTRLESSSVTLRQMGMFVADFVYQKCNGKYLFDIKEYAKERNELFNNLSNLYKAINTFPLCDDTKVVIGQITEELHKPRKINTSDIDTYKMKEVSPLMIEMEYNSDEDDSDLDDASVSKKPGIAKPVYLKDLLYYMTCDPQKDTSTYEKRAIAFSVGIEMVRLKKNTPELKYYCTKLIDAGLDIDNVGFPSNKTAVEDDIKEAVEAWRVSFLVALCTSVPELTFSYLIEGFLSNDWNFTMRIQVLTVLGLGCRELSGKEDNFILGKNKLLDSQSLPEYSHYAFLSHDSENRRKKIQDLDQEQREQRLVEALESADIGTGKEIYRSRKLEIEKNKSSKLVINQTKRTTFINKSLPRIFFTMVSVWQKINTLTQGRGFVVGHFSDHFNSHFLDVLSMIYACGVPNSIELHEMSLELIFCICGALQIVQESPSLEFPTKTFNSCINSLHTLLAENERTLAVLKSTASAQIGTLVELYSQVLSNSPPIDGTLGTVSTIIHHQLQQLLVLY